MGTCAANRCACAPCCVGTAQRSRQLARCRCRVRDRPLLLVNCHLLASGDTSIEVAALPLLLDAAEAANPGLLQQAAAAVLGER